MSHLLYSSNEMFSSTDLIRKSKMIFDKINSKEINKAIILRDGKPNFMLLNFALYEKIMAEYDMLKKMYENNEFASNDINKLKIIQKEVNNTKNDEIKQEMLEIKEDISLEVENNLSKFQDIINDKKDDDSMVNEIVPEDKNIEEELELEELQESEEQKEIREFKEKEEIELRKALEQLEALNLDPVFKEEIKEEIIIQKKPEIKEFWNK